MSVPDYISLCHLLLDAFIDSLLLIYFIAYAFKLVKYFLIDFG